MKEQTRDQNPPSAEMVDVISEIAEMRRTYTAVTSSFDGVEPGSIVISSAVAAEGKTLTASGLACMIARQGRKRVLMVDLNWYKPALHLVFGLERNFGIEELQEDTSIMDLVQKSKTAHLDVLVAPLQKRGGMNAGEQLNLLAEKIIKQAREVYDISIIDTSAMFPVNRCMLDPAVFSNKAEGVVLVVQAHATRREEVKRALMALETSGASVLGIVVNRYEKMNRR